MASLKSFSVSKYQKLMLLILALAAVVVLIFYTEYSTAAVSAISVVKGKGAKSISALLTHSSGLTWKTTTTNSVTENIIKVFAFNASNESKEVRESVSKHQCVRLRTPGEPSKICVHPREKDVYVSGSLMTSGMWEGDLVQITANSLSKHPGMALLDLGCNIGTFTIYCARLGKRVVSVDASKENLLLLSRSLELNNLQDRVTLIWNAMSDIHENVILKGYPENKGGTYVQSSNQTDPTVVVKTITLDDLVTHFRNESVFIKMDVETYEWKVLNGGYQFFKSVDVGYVLMEFSSHVKRDTGKKICDFLTGFGFRPYGTGRMQNKLLNVSQYNSWPGNVYWSKH